MPSPEPDRPGLLIRDPLRYSDTALLIPPVLVECLQCFDGAQTDLDLRAALVRLTGDLEVGQVEQHLIETLSASGFLEDEVYSRMKEARQRAFADSPHRAAVHVGWAYPEEIAPLKVTMNGYMDGAETAAGQDGLLGIAAPHVSPAGGWRSYQAAYRALGPSYKDRTFVILGTSHYGQPERFGVTRKPFITPFGESAVDLPLVDRLCNVAGPAICLEDYCHSVEHSIEFQVLFLQYLFGPDIRILPILCGPYTRSIYHGGKPEQNTDVQRFLDALAELQASEGKRLFWILGVDMAHMGRRYHDQFTAEADRGAMAEVGERDRQRIDRINNGDASGFWELVQQNRDDLKWCGSSPLYTFMKVAPQARGELLRYEQWNIDPQSVVSFGGIAFR